MLSAFRDVLTDGERHAGRLVPLGSVLLIAGLAVLGWPGAILAGIGVLLLLLACRSKRDGFLLVGPVARLELIRRTRARWTNPWLLRCVAVLFAGLIIFLTFRNAFDEVELASELLDKELWCRTTKAAAELLGAWVIVCVTFLSVQLLPSIIVDERVAKRWDILRTTDQRPREIVLGKLLGRLPTVLEPVIAIVPILAVLPLLGGLSPLFVYAILLFCIGIVCYVAGAGAFYSLFVANASTARSFTVNMAILYFVLSGIFAIPLFFIPPGWWRTALELFFFGNPFVCFALRVIVNQVYVDVVLLECAYRFALFHLALMAFFLFVAVRRLPRAEVWARTESRAVVTKRSRDGGRVHLAVNRPPVPDEAITWWERYGNLGPRQMFIVRRFNLKVLLAIALGVGLLCTVPFVLKEMTSPNLNWLGNEIEIGIHRIAILFSFGVACIAVFSALMRSSTSIPMERQQGTLEPLLLAGLTARELIVQKWQGVLLLALPLYKFSIAVLLPLAVLGYLSVIPVFLFLLCMPVLAAFAAAIGLASSATARSSLRGTLAGFGMLSLVLTLLSAIGSGISTVDDAYVLIVCFPPAVIATAKMFFGLLLNEMHHVIPYWLLGVLLYSMLTYGSLRIAAWLFGTGIVRRGSNGGGISAHSRAAC